jgi:predicted metal-dependent hydrolase
MGNITDRLVLETAPDVEVRLRRSPRARRMSLRVSRLDGRVTLSVPPALKLDEAIAFLREKSDWVLGHLAERRAAVAVVPGAVVPVEGRSVTLCPASLRGPRIEDGRMLISAARPAGPQAVAYLKALARERLSGACDRHAAALGRRYRRLTLRDTRSRWGSCTCAGDLMFSWRLAMAPPEVLDYVAAHEVAHLAEMNHSPAFWQVVRDLCPDFAEHRGWLRHQGAELHRYRFGA